MNFQDILTQLEFEEHTEDMLFEMANLRPSESGLPVTIYISTGFVEGKQLNHGPRIKVSNSYSTKFNIRDIFVMTIADDPKVIGSSNLKESDVTLIKNFVIKNKEVLEAYWDDDISTMDMLHALQKG
jgi:hypothetical protein